MKKVLMILAISLTFWGGNSFAQINVPSSGFDRSVSRASPGGEWNPGSPEWDLTLDVIKQKVRAAMDQDNQLVAEHEFLMEEYKNLQKQELEVKQKNQELQKELKDRHGRSDQQLHMEDLVRQIKLKKAEASRREKELGIIQKDVAAINQRINLKKLKMADIQLRQSQMSLRENMLKALQEQTISDNDQELTKLNEQYKQQEDQELVLIKQLDELKKAQGVATPAVVDESEIKNLQAKVDSLRTQKETLQKRLNDHNAPSDNKENKSRYRQLIENKAQLENKIQGIELQLSELKKQNPTEGSWSEQKKQLVRQISKADTQNIQLKQKVQDLKEDIALLRDQIGKLERRINLNKGFQDRRR